MLAKNPLAEAWSLLAIAQAAEIEISNVIMSSSLINYDLADGDSSDWYLVYTYPGEDTNAFRWLARRGFGVFQPMMQRAKRSTGILVQGREPIFPGWIFVYCRAIGKHATRIKACPGVAGILCDPATNRPISIDQPVLTPDRRGCIYPRVTFIDQLRAWSEQYDPNTPHARAGHSNAQVRANRNIKRSTRRLTPKERKNLGKMTSAAKERGIWDEEQWEQVMKLDPGARIGVLLAVLKSASDAGCSALTES